MREEGKDQGRCGEPRVLVWHGEGGTHMVELLRGSTRWPGRFVDNPGRRMGQMCLQASPAFQFGDRCFMTQEFGESNLASHIPIVSCI